MNIGNFILKLTTNGTDHFGRHPRIGASLTYPGNGSSSVKDLLIVGAAAIVTLGLFLFTRSDPDKDSPLALMDKTSEDDVLAYKKKTPVVKRIITTDPDTLKKVEKIVRKSGFPHARGLSGLPRSVLQHPRLAQATLQTCNKSSAPSIEDGSTSDTEAGSASSVRTTVSSTTASDSATVGTTAPKSTLFTAHTITRRHSISDATQPETSIRSLFPFRDDTLIRLSYSAPTALATNPGLVTTGTIISTPTSFTARTITRRHSLSDATQPKTSIRSLFPFRDDTLIHLSGSAPASGIVTTGTSTSVSKPATVSLISKIWDFILTYFACCFRWYNKTI